MTAIYWRRVQIRRVRCPYLEMTFRRPQKSGGDVLVRLRTASNTMRFRLSDNERKRRVFRGVKDLIDKRPSRIKAIGVSASRTLPPAVLKVVCVSFTNYAFFAKL